MTTRRGVSARETGCLALNGLPIVDVDVLEYPGKPVVPSSIYTRQEALRLAGRRGMRGENEEQITQTTTRMITIDRSGAGWSVIVRCRIIRGFADDAVLLKLID